MKFSIKDFFSKFDQTRSFLRIWSYLLKKSLMENFIFLCSDIPTIAHVYTLFDNPNVYLTIIRSQNMLHECLYRIYFRLSFAKSFRITFL